MLSPGTSVKYLKTVGKQRANYLSQLGIKTVEDLLYYFPRDIQDRRNLSSITTSLTPAQKTTVIGKILATDIVYTKKNLGIFKVVIETSLPQHPLVCLVWYKKLNKKYDVFHTLKQNFSQDSQNKYIVAYGKVAENVTRIPELFVEDYELINDFNEVTIHTNRLVPVYPLNENLSQQWFRELMFNTLEKVSITDHLPEKIRSEEKLLDLFTAIKNVHFPEVWQNYEKAKHRLVFDKFFLFQLAVVNLKKQILSKPKVGKYKLNRTLLTPFKERLKLLIPNFDFTRAQKRVINELFRDMFSSRPMNRLLIGDVGSGKTLVAVSCALLAVENGYQVVFMAPTEILAEQHYYNLKSYITGLKNPVLGREVNISLYLGKTSKKDKEKILSQLLKGEIDIIIGTHSLIEEKVKFKNLSFIIVDEQHKFGVLQRKQLYEKTTLPDILIMTATPIPRSLAMTVYGELDISVLDELPPGRKPIKTLFYKDENEMLKFVLEHLSYGMKVYIVYPIIEDTKLELKTLIEEYHRLSSTIFKEYPCGLLHGKMKYKEKEETMLKFKFSEYKILFSTQVIEVGIDIPDATLIVINHAERFGLAQLHQLRGRVGRSTTQSYCILTGNLSTEEAKRRIKVMLETNDGFKIAEEDLLLRGPGNIFGTEQHGLGDINYSEVIKYHHLLIKAKEYAKKVVFENEFGYKDLILCYKKLNSIYGGTKFYLGNIG